MKTVISAAVEHLDPFYTLSLPFELSSGRYVIIRWKPTTKESTSFNFADGHDFNSKVLFHFNPRINEDTVVRNSKDGSWGSEERDGDMPIKLEVTCEIKIVVRSDFYECYLDGVKHCTFNHRLPVETAKYFFVSGTGEVYNVTFGDEAVDEDCCEDITLPHSEDVNIFTGCRIYFSGIPNTNDTRVRVILKADEDYALCFAVRMEEEVVVMNNKVDDEWGTEERPEEFPFKVDQFFNICIEVANDKFQMWVNDKHFAEFKHRILPISKINGLEVDGDAKVCAIWQWVS